jgi:VanZ family protein
MRRFGETEADNIGSKRLRAWIYVGIMMFCILFSLPLTPILWGKAVEQFGSRFNAVGYVVLLLLAGGFSVYMIRHRRELGMFRFLLLAGLLFTYGCLLKYHCRFPAERLHLMEYGLLAYLSYSGLRLHLSRMSAYVLGFLISSAFGFLDEVIQYVLPNRVFEYRDVMTNVIASALGLLVAGFCLKAGSNDERSNGAKRCL